MCRINLVAFVTALIVLAGCESSSDYSEPSAFQSKQDGIDKHLRYKLVAYAPAEFLYPDPLQRKLAVTAADGKLDEAATLIKNGANVNYQGNLRVTPLYWSLRNANLIGFSYLLEKGADPNIVFEDGGNVLNWAVQMEDVDFLKAALEFGGDPNITSKALGSTPLMSAIFHDRSVFKKDFVLALARSGADLEKPNSFGVSPLVMAIRMQRSDYASLLISLGAQCSAKHIREVNKRVVKWFPSEALWESAKTECTNDGLE